MSFNEYFNDKITLEPMSLIIENSDLFQITENLSYHIENNLSLSESAFRFGSDKWLDLVNEVRNLYHQGYIKINENDEFIVLTEAGRKGIYQGKEVTLDVPRRGGSKKFYVYTNSGRKNAEGRVVAKKVAFGDPNLTVKNYSPERRKSFRARHKCHLKTDKTTAGWWSCNVARYRKSLGLTSDKPW